MFTVNNILLFLMFWCLITSVWLILRWRALKRGYKMSDKQQFIDFLEIDYLGLWKFSWRRKFNSIYNSNKYWILYGIVIAILLIIAGITAYILIWLYNNGGMEILDYKV